MAALQKSSRKLLILRCFIEMRTVGCIQRECSGLLSTLSWVFPLGENSHGSNRTVLIERQVHIISKFFISSKYHNTYFKLIHIQDQNLIILKYGTRFQTIQISEGLRYMHFDLE